MRARSVASVVAALALFGCQESGAAAADGGSPDGGSAGLGLLGGGSHDPANVDLVEVTVPADGIYAPRDIAFSPVADHELWILNPNSRMVIVSQVGTPERSAVSRRGLGWDHFMPSPSAMAFGDATMATVHEIDDVTQPSTPADFMGPSLWPIDPSTFDGGHSSHLDMLHNSPNAVGVAWDSGNAFWVFDGAHASITFYDFGADHGPAGEDHSDGVIQRWVEGQVGYVEGVSSHLELDHATGLLYIADTGNGRIATLDTRAGALGGGIGPNYDGASMNAMESPPLSTLVEGSSVGLEHPSGLALRDGVLYVTDHARSIVHAFDTAGVQLDFLDLSTVVPEGALGAVDLDAEGRLYVVDLQGSRVLRIAPRS